MTKDVKKGEHNLWLLKGASSKQRKQQVQRLRSRILSRVSKNSKDVNLVKTKSVRSKYSRQFGDTSYY